ncbi:MAG: TonB-dependent receptor [Bacteroidales bacterium]|nr:TonB-dependent receptor [Bacteroidales bacterium]
MKRLILISLFLFVVFQTGAFAQKFTLSGKVTDKSTGKPVDFATVVVEGTGQWAIADIDGVFSIKNVPASKTRVTISCLGYVDWSREISIQKDIPNLQVALDPDNLTLESAVVTAKDDSNSATTSRTIDRTALDHVQIMNVADISGLLPGGATVDPSLTSEKQFNIRAGSGESGNASFGTVVEVDGVRLSNNASFAEASTSNTLKGVATNNIASTNVESVEVITGVPSVEYGDMSSGVVKVNLKKGRTPWMLTLSTSPNTKQASASKGFGLGVGKNGVPKGVINASAEYTQSISKQMSPYTAYRREQMSLSYMNFFNTGVFASVPLRFNLGVTGNLGGMDTKADPDAVQGTWAKARDNALRANFSLNWLLSKPWITSVDLSGSISYSDKNSRERTHNSSSINKTVLHGRETGYYMAMPYSEDVPDVMYIPAGYWYNIMCNDDRPMTTKLSFKANLSRFIKAVNNKLKVGADWTTDRNFGIGQFSDEMATAPTFREYRYCDVPTMHNAAVYLEDNVMIPVGMGRINLIAGLRNDNTIVRGSAYGTTSSLSPRFNAKYTILQRQGRERRKVKELSLRASWGEAVKLPSFSILFPMPTYRDVRVFTSTTNSSNESFQAYFIEPRSIVYNPDLKWQRNRMLEAGVETDIFGNKISLTGFWTRTLNSYRISTHYDRTSYSYTPDAYLSSVTIPADDRVFSIDRSSGVVTVSDKTGSLGQQQLDYITYKELAPSYFPDNETNPIDRYGIEWVIDFARIKPINTDIRLDGTWYSYKSIGANMVEYCPYTQRSAADNMPYPYIGYYYGNNAVSNGSESRTLRMNLTVTTHIPKVRMILSAKLEACLLRYSRTLSETSDGEELAKVVSSISDILSTTGESIYAGDNYAVRYPLYYSSYDDPVQRDYLSALKEARESGNMDLYNDLWQLTYKTNYLYIFNKDYFSPFFSANFSITKEIGDLASISFYANNFFVNRSQIWSSKSRTFLSASSYVPKFYYGLTLRLKF